jgi:hypothetical protein
MTSKEFKEKRRAKYNTPSVAQEILQGKQLLTTRPADLPYVLYRKQRQHETQLIRTIFAGRPDPVLQQAMMDRRPLLKFDPSKFKKNDKKE